MSDEVTMAMTNNNGRLVLSFLVRPHSNAVVSALPFGFFSSPLI